MAFQPRPRGACVTTSAGAQAYVAQRAYTPPRLIGCTANIAMGGPSLPVSRGHTPPRPFGSISGGVPNGVVAGSAENLLINAGRSGVNTARVADSPNDKMEQDGLALYPGQSVEVFSKSTGHWTSANVLEVDTERVRVRYLASGQLCEKILPRTSDSLRLAKIVSAATGSASPRGANLSTTPPSVAGGVGTFGTSARGTTPPAGGFNHVTSRTTPPGASPTLGCKAESRGVYPRTLEGILASGEGASQPRTSGRSLTPPSDPGSLTTVATPQQRQWVRPSSRTPTQQQQQQMQQQRSPQPAPRRGRSCTPPPPLEGQENLGRDVAGQRSAQQVLELLPAGTPAPATQRQSHSRSEVKLPEQQKGNGGQPEKDVLVSSELELGRVLGTGSCGSVYYGRYCGQEVAIKKLHPAETAVTEAQLAEFRREVANLKALRHRRLVTFIGAAFTEPCMCIVTEFMPNGSLYQLLHERKEAITAAQRASLAVQVAEGIEFLHTRSPPFVHRDLKSLNVVLDLDLNAKLCDFGFTECMEKTHISRRENTQMGSPRYMAPELLDSGGRITEKVDIWALGCLVLEVFTGRLPHEECTSLQQIIAKMLVRRQEPYLGLQSRRLLRLAECCFKFESEKRVGVARVLESLRALEVFPHAATS